MATESQRTRQGHTVAECAGRFSIIGAIAGVASGVVLAILDLLGFNVTAMLLAPGLTFGIAMAVAIERFIGSVSTLKRIFLIPGCLAGFAIIGTLLELLSNEPVFPVLPQFWNRCVAYLTASAAGFLFITALVSWTTQVFRWKNHLALWFAGTTAGFIAILVVLEFSRTSGDISVLMVVSNTGVQIIVLGSIGWQLAGAQISQSRSNQT